MRPGLFPRLQDLLFIVLLLGVLAVGTRMLNIDSDLGRHLALGSYMLTFHQIPTTDILSSTKSGAPRPPYEWLAQVLLEASNRFLNLDGVVLLTAAVIAAAFSVVYLDAVRRSHAPILALLITFWAAIASSLHWLPRPHVFSFLFLAIWLYWLESLHRGERVRLWYFPALMLIWSNIHGGFIYGFLVLGAYFAGWLIDTVRGYPNRALGISLLIIGAAAAVASIITPDLWRPWEAVLNNRSSYILSQTVETMPIHFTVPAVWPFLAMVVAAAALLALCRFRVPAAHMVLLAGLAMLGFGMVRNIPLFTIAAAPLLTQWAAQILGLVPPWRLLETRIEDFDAKLGRFVWSGIALLLVVGIFVIRDARSQAPVFQFRSDVFPVQAADWAVSHPPAGLMFNDFNWGGYLLYRLWPGQRIFIDSQSDFYGEGLTRQAVSIAAGEPGWETALDRYNIKWILVPRSAGLSMAAIGSPRWRVAYHDDVAIVLVRK